ncbi:MAG: hypothetical protein WC878_00200 [Candidatus Paceibacterota bacterium]
MKKESFSSKEREKFHFKEIEQLRVPVENIVKKLYPKISAGEYGLIFGDDASGRIPALLLNEIIQGMYREFGHKNPDICFFAGSKNLEGEEKNEKKEMISQYLESLKKKNPEDFQKKALIVTDVIATGVSLDPLIEVLKEKGIDFDIASVGDVTTEDVESKWGKDVYFGASGLPKIFGLGSVSGVEKNVNELFSHRIKDNDAYTDDEKMDIQININEAREDVSRLAAEILEKMRKEKEIV